MSEMELVATTLLGIEALTARELKNLGIEVIKVEDGRVTFSGDELTICQANMWLRTAERVLVKLGEFEATTFDELFEKTKALDWHKWITEDGTFPVKAYSLKSKLHSVPDCQAIVKKAVVEKLKSVYKKDWFEENGPAYKIHLALFKDKATLMIDTSGEGLHKRGYREISNEAPLKETLASSLILLSNWKPDKPFIDPFCGSGTIPIEAAMIGANIAPGLNRAFSCEKWPQISEKSWEITRSQANNLVKNDIELNIRGYDIDSAAIRLSIQNSSIARVKKHVYFKQAPVDKLSSDDNFGTIICNPPYGERLGDIKEAEKIYKQMGQVFSSLDTWSYYILSSHENFENIFGRKSDKNRKLYNGMIKCYFYQYFGSKPRR